MFLGNTQHTDGISESHFTTAPHLCCVFSVFRELKSLRERLQARLERELQQMEQWWHSESNSEALPRLQAQSLADQLAAVDELEGQLKRLLGQSGKAE